MKPAIANLFAVKKRNRTLHLLIAGASSPGVLQASPVCCGNRHAAWALPSPASAATLGNAFPGPSLTHANDAGSSPADRGLVGTAQYFHRHDARLGESPRHVRLR